MLQKNQLMQNIIIKTNTKTLSQMYACSMCAHKLTRDKTYENVILESCIEIAKV